MWDAVTGISTGVALAAFLAAAALSAYRYNLKSRARVIRSLPADSRGEALARELNAFGLDASRLSREQQFQLALREFDIRRARLRLTTVVVIILAVIPGVVALVSILSDSIKSTSQSQIAVATVRPPDTDCTRVANVRQRMLNFVSSQYTLAKHLVTFGDGDDTVWTNLHQELALYLTSAEKLKTDVGTETRLVEAMGDGPYTSFMQLLDAKSDAAQAAYAHTSTSLPDPGQRRFLLQRGESLKTLAGVVVQTCSKRTSASDALHCLQAPSIAFQISGAVPP